MMAILTLYPSMRGHLGAHPALATAIVEESARHHVSPTILAAVGMLESRLGADTPRTFGLTARGVAWLCRRGSIRCDSAPERAQAEGAAAVLETGLSRCRTLAGALRYFNRGRCDLDARRYAARVIELSERIAHLVEVNAPATPRPTSPAHPTRHHAHEHARRR